MILLLLNLIIGIIIIPFVKYEYNKYIQVLIQLINFVIVFILIKSSETRTMFEVNHYFMLDALNSVILLVISFIGLLAYFYSIGYLDREKSVGLSELKLKEYYLWLNFFMFAMIGLSISNNLGILWVFIEATTLATTFLISFYKNKNAVEAAWKYIILCSVGIAFALFGIILLYFGVINLSGASLSSLNWSHIYKIAPNINKDILKIAFAFVIVGFGTKMGLAPLHFWLPDAHSEAPTPVSALMSGVLLNCSLYAILRVFSIMSHADLGYFASSIIFYFGLFSVIMASVFIPKSRDYKRLLAYSTMEHMGIIAFSIGIDTPIGVFAGLLGIIAHALTKSLMFFGAGSVLSNMHTKNISDIRGLFSSMPITSSLLTFGVFAISATPPTMLFSSEFLAVFSAFKTNHIVESIIVLIMLGFIFFGFVDAFFGMLTGKSNHKNVKESIYMLIPMFLLAFIIISFGIFLPSSLETLLENASNIVRGNL